MPPTQICTMSGDEIDALVWAYDDGSFGVTYRDRETGNMFSTGAKAPTLALALTKARQAIPTPRPSNDDFRLRLVARLERPSATLTPATDAWRSARSGRIGSDYV